MTKVIISFESIYNKISPDRILLLQNKLQRWMMSVITLVIQCYSEKKEQHNCSSDETLFVQNCYCSYKPLYFPPIMTDEGVTISIAFKSTLYLL